MKAYILDIRFILIIIYLLFSINLYSQVFGGGTGTAEDPYQIWNIEQWDNFTAQHNNQGGMDLNGKHIRLMADIGPQ